MALTWPPAPLSEIWVLSLIRNCLLTHRLNIFQRQPSSTSVTFLKSGTSCLNKMQKKLVHAFVTSRLDYCNSLFSDCPNKILKALQFIPNAAACVLHRTNIGDHIPLGTALCTDSQLNSKWNLNSLSSPTKLFIFRHYLYLTDKAHSTLPIIHPEPYTPKMQGYP